MDSAGCCAGHDMPRGALTMFGALTALFAGSNCATTAQEFDTARRRFSMTLLAGFAALALVAHGRNAAAS